MLLLQCLLSFSKYLSLMVVDCKRICSPGYIQMWYQSQEVVCCFWQCSCLLCTTSYIGRTFHRLKKNFFNKIWVSRDTCLDTFCFKLYTPPILLPDTNKPSTPHRTHTNCNHHHCNIHSDQNNLSQQVPPMEKESKCSYNVLGMNKIHTQGQQIVSTNN